MAIVIVSELEVVVPLMARLRIRVLVIVYVVVRVVAVGSVLVLVATKFSTEPGARLLAARRTLPTLGVGGLNIAIELIPIETSDKCKPGARRPGKLSLTLSPPRPAGCLMMV